MPSPATRLFTAADLADFVGEPVTDGRATSIERVVWGWLRKPLGLTARPTEPDEQLVGWAVELGAIAHANPAALESAQFGDVAERYDAARRAAILAEVAEASGTPGAAPRPRGKFPPPACPVDPAAPRISPVYGVRW